MVTFFFRPSVFSHHYPSTSSSLFYLAFFLVPLTRLLLFVVLRIRQLLVLRHFLSSCFFPCTLAQSCFSSFHSFYFRKNNNPSPPTFLFCISQHLRLVPSSNTAFVAVYFFPFFNSSIAFSSLRLLFSTVESRALFSFCPFSLQPVLSSKGNKKNTRPKKNFLSLFVYIFAPFCRQNAPREFEQGDR